MQYRSATFAFVRELEQVRRRGKPVTVRGRPTHELLARQVTLEKPRERFITIPGRGNDPVATIAETMWVLAGHSDMAFLSRYLSRATDYSDDGVVWRAAYGPRIRAWGEQQVDQIDAVRQLLSADPTSRRAVAAIYDPAQDFANESKDVPCNNWLHFMLREGRLDLNVVIRSNDIFWGFSGINTFEWSVLHEAMAFWVGASVGPVNFFISSLHLYDEFDDRAERCLSRFDERSGYESGWGPVGFATPWESFDEVVSRWFEIEAGLAEGQNRRSDVEAFPDPLLRDFLRAVQVKWANKYGASDDELRGLVDAIGHTDVAFALHELYFKDSRSLLPQGPVAIEPGALVGALTDLHRSKDASYGNSWKRRGEQVSILANIARKADRIENVIGGSPAGSESLLDTAADLYVYALKYETFLADQDAAAANAIFGRTGNGFSDGPAGFSELIAARGLPEDFGEIDAEAAAVVAQFDVLDKLVRLGSPSISEKSAASRRLTDDAARLLQAIVSRTPDPVATLRAEIA
jgi:thymidylate synthase